MCLNVTNKILSTPYVCQKKGNFFFLLNPLSYNVLLTTIRCKALREMWTYISCILPMLLFVITCSFLQN